MTRRELLSHLEGEHGLLIPSDERTKPVLEDLYRQAHDDPAAGEVFIPPPEMPFRMLPTRGRRSRSRSTASWRTGTSIDLPGSAANVVTMP